MTRKEWYARVSSAWDSNRPLPELTGVEAVRAAAKMWRFVLGQTCPFDIVETGRGRYSWTRWADGKKVLAVIPRRGWDELVHDLSHLLFNQLYRGEGLKPHDKRHARLELKLRKEALKRGWLSGTLK